MNRQQYLLELKIKWDKRKHTLTQTKNLLIDISCTQAFNKLKYYSKKNIVISELWYEEWNPEIEVERRKTKHNVETIFTHTPTRIRTNTSQKKKKLEQQKRERKVQLNSLNVRLTQW